MNEFFNLLQSTENVESTLALHNWWTPESQNSFGPLKASQVPPIWAVVDEAQLEHLGKGAEVADEVMGGDVEVVVEVRHCAVLQVPGHQDHLWASQSELWECERRTLQVVRIPGGRKGSGRCVLMRRRLPVKLCVYWIGSAIKEERSRSTYIKI